MVRCGCASDQCSCVIVAGENVAISGGGTRSNPYNISAATQVILEGEGIELVDRIVGEVIMFGGSAEPSGWLFCDGREISRSVYGDLFAVIGTSYGAGDGTDTFNLPNMAGVFPMGTSGTAPRGTQGGSSQTTLATANLPAHAHTIDHSHGAAGDHDHTLDRSTATGGSNASIPQGTASVTAGTSAAAIANSGSHTHPAFTGNSGNTGSGTPFENRPPFVAINFLIRSAA